MQEYSKKLSKFIKCLDYKFNNNYLLVQALTHGSVSYKFKKSYNNQRLEFLGDSVLNFIITDYLYQFYPDATEGDLTKFRAYLVKEATLVIIAKKLNIPDYLILGFGERKTKGYNKQSILADTVEALIGAIYLDSNFKTIKKLVLTWYKDITIKDDIADAKTKLQELLQNQGLNLPIYKVITITGKAHNQAFKVECIIDNNIIKHKIYGIGPSRKKAEQDAAQKVLKIIK